MLAQLCTDHCTADSIIRQQPTQRSHRHAFKPATDNAMSTLNTRMNTPIIKPYTTHTLTRHSKPYTATTLNHHLHAYTSTTYPIADDPHYIVPPFCLQFAPTELQCTYVLVADEDGTVHCIDYTQHNPLHRRHRHTQYKSDITPTLDDDRERLQSTHRYTCHTNAIFDVQWLTTTSSIQFITTSGDQSARIFDLDTSTQLHCLTGHVGSVKSVSQSTQNGNIFVTGARDGTINVWDVRVSESSTTSQNHTPVHTIPFAHQSPDSSPTHSSANQRRKSSLNADRLSVTTVLFNKTDPHTFVSSSAADSIVKVWDIRTLSRSQQTTAKQRAATPQCASTIQYGGCSSQRKFGISALSMDATGTLLAASCTDNNIYLYDNTAVCDTQQQCIGVYAGHKSKSFYVKSALSHDGKYILSGSTDKQLYLYSTTPALRHQFTHTPRTYMPTAVLTGHRGEATAVAWCDRLNDAGLPIFGSTGDDATMRLWSCDYAKKYEADICRLADLELNDDNAAEQTSSSEEEVVSDSATVPVPQSTPPPPTRQLMLTDMRVPDTRILHDITHITTSTPHTSSSSSAAVRPAGNSSGRVLAIKRPRSSVSPAGRLSGAKRSRETKLNVLWKRADAQSVNQT